MPRRFLHAAVLGGLAALATSCYFVRSPSRPVPALAFRHPSVASAHCLVVFLPGFLDTPDTYLDNDFPRELVRSGAPCDSVGVDLHFRYYGAVGVADVVYEDVLQPAIARGYEEIWLVGISMGGLGALLTATRYGEHIDGIVLIAPFVGDEAVLREIEAAGGPRTWEPAETVGTELWTTENYTQKIWRWLRGYHTDPDSRPPLYLGWGSGDRLGPAERLLGELLPEGHVFVREGTHAWATWGPIWREMVGVVPLGRLTHGP